MAHWICWNVTTLKFITKALISSKVSQKYAAYLQLFFSSFFTVQYWSLKLWYNTLKNVDTLHSSYYHKDVSLTFGAKYLFIYFPKKKLSYIMKWHCSAFFLRCKDLMAQHAETVTNSHLFSRDFKTEPLTQWEYCHFRCAHCYQELQLS